MMYKGGIINIEGKRFFYNGVKPERVQLWSRKTKSSIVLGSP
jgi:hypothetical protein